MMTRNLAVHSGLRALRDEVARELFSLKLPVPRDSATHLVLDAPLGWALGWQGGIDTRPVIIVSDNPCPEYRLDLLDQGPIALLSDASVLDIVKVLRGTLPPQQLYETPLTGVERATLRLIATDHSSCAIAQTRGVSEQVVKNTISALYQKLHLKTRLQAAHYYFGNWHLLLQRGWTPPQHVSVPKALQQDS